MPSVAPEATVRLMGVVTCTVLTAPLVNVILRKSNTVGFRVTVKAPDAVVAVIGCIFCENVAALVILEEPEIDKLVTARLGTFNAPVTSSYLRFDDVVMFCTPVTVAPKLCATMVVPLTARVAPVNDVPVFEV